MAGLFLSHSSKDKAFVTKLAADLVSRGIPVWFDSWELETGDSLNERLFKSIDESTYLILALSPDSITSPWVTRELNAALEKEQALGRKVILPIKLAGCALPEAIADRVYADFSSGYLMALDRLETLLRKVGAGTIPVELEKELVPLVFARGVFLDVVRVQARIDHLRTRLREGGRLTTEQILTVPDVAYDEAKAAFLRLLENYPNLPTYSTDTHQELNLSHDFVRRGEKALTAGIAELVNGLVAGGESGFVYLAADWYARIVRHEILARFEIVRNLKEGEDVEFPTKPIGAILSNPDKAARFFEVERVIPCDVFQHGSRKYIRVWVDDASEAGQWFASYPQVPRSLFELWSPQLMYKYVVPQMLARHLWLDRVTPLAWDLAGNSSDWRIGLA